MKPESLVFILMPLPKCSNKDLCDHNQHISIALIAFLFYYVNFPLLPLLISILFRNFTPDLINLSCNKTYYEYVQEYKGLLFSLRIFIQTDFGSLVSPLATIVGSIAYNINSFCPIVHSSQPNRCC